MHFGTFWPYDRRKLFVGLTTLFSRLFLLITSGAPRCGISTSDLAQHYKVGDDNEDFCGYRKCPPIVILPNIYLVSILVTVRPQCRALKFSAKTPLWTYKTSTCDPADKKSPQIPPLFFATHNGSNQHPVVNVARSSRLCTKTRFLPVLQMSMNSDLVQRLGEHAYLLKKARSVRLYSRDL
jgi:hypothetical protein